MLAYAANRRVVGERQSSPHGLLIVIAAHIALIAVVMSAKMDLPRRLHPGAIRVTFLPVPKPPPPNALTQQPQHHPLPTPSISEPQHAVPLPLPNPAPIGPQPTVDVGAVAGGHAPSLLTPSSELRPPYPPSKLLSEEEATLRLKLTISETGRVTAVDPIGGADREFLEAARRYLIAHWQYQPATEDGRAVASSTVITLRFQLDG